MSDDLKPAETKSEEEAVEQAKNILIMGVVIVIAIAAIFAFILYSRMNPG